MCAVHFLCSDSFVCNIRLFVGVNPTRAVLIHHPSERWYSVTAFLILMATQSLCSFLRLQTLPLLTLNWLFAGVSNPPSCDHVVWTYLKKVPLSVFTEQSHAHTHSLSLVLVVMIKSKELKTKISHTHSLILSLLNVFLRTSSRYLRTSLLH